MEESERQSTIIWGADNTFKRYLVEKGDVDAVWKEAAHIVEGEYFTGAQEQLYIENNGIIAAFDPKNGVTVWGSLQCPYYVHKALMALCGLPEDKIRVVQMETGGAFGGKEEYPSMIAGHAALLAIKSGRPVRSSMTARKTWWQRRSGILREPAIAPRLARWENSRRRNRVHHRWRSLCHIVVGGFIAGHHSRGRSLLLAECAHSREGRGNEYAASWGFSRIWRAAEPLCHGAAYGPHRPSRGDLSSRNPPTKFPAARPNYNDGTDHSRKY